MTKEEASKLIKSKISMAEDLIIQSTKLADEFGLSFDMDYGRGHEGGDTYYGENCPEGNWLSDRYYKDYGWVTSTMSCS